MRRVKHCKQRELDLNSKRKCEINNRERGKEKIPKKYEEKMSSFLTEDFGDC